jgi:hypothetical protein
LNDGIGNYSRSEGAFPQAHYLNSSCISIADIDGDGDLDIAIGEASVPFKYGLPSGVKIFTNNGKGKFTDVSESLSPELGNLGMITDIVFQDINNDSRQDLIIAGEWMPVSIFLNQPGKFEKAEYPGLERVHGLWNTLAVADFDNNGTMDIAAGNLGMNTQFKASDDQPMFMYVNDFDFNGTVEQIICTHNNDTLYPVIQKTELVMQIPSLKKKILKFENYKHATYQNLFEEDQKRNALEYYVNSTASCIFFNDNGDFSFKEFPLKAQFSPIFDFEIIDINSDGLPDLLAGGNLYQAKPQTGIYAASYGLALVNSGKGEFKPDDNQESGFFVKGAVRDIEKIKFNGENFILVGRNSDSLVVFKQKDLK